MQLSANTTEIDLRVSAAEFSLWLERLGPFESTPRLAVACSGGPDSMALLGLTHDWTKRSGGNVVALIVDHRLRIGSSREAAEVAKALCRYGIRAEILTREGGEIHSGLQERAREARYRLLQEYCRKHGILHLLVAHHRDDQVETVFMRKAKASGVDGLAGMTFLLEYKDVRILRPLIDCSKGRLRATVASWNLPVVEDPSNNDERFERVRIRRRPTAPALANELIEVASRNSLVRRDRESAVAAGLAQTCALFPEGYALLDPLIFSSVSTEIAHSCLAAICAMIGGKAHPPRRARTAQLLKVLTEDRISGGRTLSGCRIVPKGQKLLFFREANHIEPAMRVETDILWDGRFRVEISDDLDRLEVTKLGEEGVRELRDAGALAENCGIPSDVLVTLPAIMGVEGVRYVPHLCYSRNGDTFNGKIRFAPIRPLQATRFTL